MNNNENKQKMARCSYYGKTFRREHIRGRCECPSCLARADNICHCERLSSQGEDGNLAFFSSKPFEKYDTFYCGCFGWD